MIVNCIFNNINDGILGQIYVFLQRHGRRYLIVDTGWSQVVVMQPFEIIKVRLQTQSK